MSGTESVQVGYLVAVYCENYADGPSIGKCLQVTDTNIQLEWMKGSYTSSWATWIVPDETNRRKKVPWTDWVPKDFIILFDFRLTATNRLRKTTAKHLQLKYNELRA